MLRCLKRACYITVWCRCTCSPIRTCTMTVFKIDMHAFQSCGISALVLKIRLGFNQKTHKCLPIRQSWTGNGDLGSWQLLLTKRGSVGRLGCSYCRRLAWEKTFFLTTCNLAVFSSPAEGLTFSGLEVNPFKTKRPQGLRAQTK